MHSVHRRRRGRGRWRWRAPCVNAYEPTNARGVPDLFANFTWADASSYPDLPVVCINQCDAYAFCASVGKHLCGSGPRFGASDELYVACASNGGDYPAGDPQPARPLSPGADFRSPCHTNPGLVRRPVVNRSSDGRRVSSGYGSIESSTLATHVPFVARVAESGVESSVAKSFSGPQDRTCFENRKECLVPRAVADDFKRLFVACVVSNEVLVIDPARDAEHAPACLQTIAERPRLAVGSPTAVALTENDEAWAYSSITHELTNLGSPDAIAGTSVPSTITVPATTPKTEKVEMGQRLFHESANRKISADGRACASCHVDGRDDGLVWPTPTGERQTPMLAGCLDGTAPYGWNGDHETVALHIKQTIANLGGSGLDDKRSPRSPRIASACTRR